LDNEIPLKSLGRQHIKTIARINPPGLRSKEYNDNIRQHQQRPCAYADIKPAEPGSEQNSAISKRPVITAVARRIPGIEETVLGPTFMGKGILLCNGRERDRGNYKEIYRKPRHNRKRHIHNNRRMSFSHD